MNEHLADALSATASDRVTFYAYGRRLNATIATVVPAKGLGGFGMGATVNEDAFFSPRTLRDLATGTGHEVATITLVTNRGGVEDRARLSGTVNA